MKLRSLAENLMFSTVRIESYGQDDKGVQIGCVGTGFIFGYGLDAVEQGTDGEWGFFLVTNRHVLDGFSEAHLTFIQADPEKGPLLAHGVKQPIENLEEAWFGHPDKNVDIAVMPINQLVHEFKDEGINTYATPIVRGHVPTPEVLSELDVTNQVFFIGYPNGRRDELNLTPIVRSGHIATPIDLNYAGQPQFIIDASVFPGSSGSPVFLTDTAAYKDKSDNVQLGGRRVWFLGVISAAFVVWNDGRLDIDPAPTMSGVSISSQEMIDLGVVLKSYTVLETIEAYVQKYPFKEPLP